MNKALVIGGANTDILGFADTLIENESNIGRISIQSGGVGRNIAENLRLLGLDVSIISVFGDDMLSETLKFNLIQKGVDVSHSVTLQGSSSCMYMAIMGADGDMKLAVNDMQPMQHLDRQTLARYADWINGFDILVPDANLSRDTLQYIQETFKMPIIFDPVSITKAAKLEDIILGFGTLKLNEYEAGHLAGVDDVGESARRLVKMGLERVFVTCGERGSYYADSGGEFGFAAAIPTRATNATGAGDAYTAGVAFGTLMDMPTADCAIFATACSSIAIMSESAVNRNMSITAVQELLTN